MFSDASGKIQYKPTPSTIMLWIIVGSDGLDFALRIIVATANCRHLQYFVLHCSIVMVGDLLRANGNSSLASREMKTLRVSKIIIWTCTGPLLLFACAVVLLFKPIVYHEVLKLLFEPNPNQTCRYVYRFTTFQ